jgi:hypothetical protein
MPRICVLAFFVAGTVQAQETKPPPRADVKHAAPASAADPSPEAKAAFLALSEADRKALQDGLGWLGVYNGVTDGAYGKRSIEALVAYQQSLGAAADGVVTSKMLAAVKDAAAKAKVAVGFKIVDDAPTGVRIGAPLKLLDKRSNGAGTSSLAAKDGAILLEMKETSGKLAALFKTLTADAPNRKVTYKYIKPDAFLVVAGEEGEKKFYRRYAAPPAGAADPDKLRGFVFLYPKARAKALDPVALAIANAFDPFPAAPLPPTKETPPKETPPPTPEGPMLTATALVVAPGVAVTTLPAAGCKAPTIQGKPVQFLEGAGGLTRLGGDFGAGATAPALGAGGGDLVALSLASAGGTKTTLQVSEAAPGGAAHVIAALGAGASGAPLFDRQGRLVAFVAPFQAPASRAGVALAAPHATVSAAGAGETGAAPTGEALMSAPQLAAKLRSAVVGVFCAS